MDILADDTSKEESRKTVFSLMAKFKDMKPTKLNVAAIQALVFTLYMRSYLHES